MNDVLGMPSETSWLPDMQWHYPEEMSLYQRIMNTYSAVYWNFYRTETYYPRIEKIFRETLGLKDLPDFKDLDKNVSLVLANTHFAEEYARSMPPLVVPVGGMHCYLEKTETPKDLKLFMNGTGSNGFFYVSFGSAAELAKMPAGLRNTFFNAMSNSKTKFLLKWSGEVPPDMPKNVFTVSWVPQQNVLSHPNIKGFITHGGLLGIQEAVCSGVPLIVMPIFAEQDFNANRVHNRRRGIKMELTTLTQADLEKAISSLLTDPSYKQNMLRASKLFLDRPQKPQDLAVWWTEYILRHGSVDEMKPLGIHQTWYQRRLIDVSFVVFLSLLLPVLVLLLLYGRFKMVSSKPKSKTMKHE
jgi:glucuronosyltransferase